MTGMEVAGMDRIERGDPRFEEAISARLFNKLEVDRRPDAVLVPRTEDDVVAAVVGARAEARRVAVRSGGHSWIGASVRDSGVLLDMSSFAHVSIDRSTRTARIGPAVTSAQLVAALAAEGFAYPAGNCGTPGAGGYLLGGGLGLNWGHWKPACYSIRSVRVVTASGELVTASESENADLLWLARGSCPGFPGVVTEFEIELQDRPLDTRVSSWLFPLADLSAVTAWVARASAELPTFVEVAVVTFGPDRPMLPPGDGVPDHLVGVTAMAFVDDEEEARRALAPLAGGPGVPHLVYGDLDAVPFESLHFAFDASFPEGHRYLADTFWTDATTEGVLPDLRDLLERAPSGKSFVMAIMPGNGAATTGLPQDIGAYSMDARTLVLPYVVWEDPADDAANRSWLGEIAGRLERHSSGHFLSEVDLTVAPDRLARSFSAESWSRLQELRRRYDPEQLFHGYPEPIEKALAEDA
ncbi:FAD-binding oxidoreductase [Blastococcus sp. PRF04-17]|uniref:FAD-binding oxidoreductase n=1 Tax=Blastococcus sp. PRF04-17 TaxID=2933797 RepID=UPI001FF21762|nr:FAD-binding oxidoreductase [Blastococcus sp. PRF04-17]UOY02260.1 FAD-binding oxidoreductase [Blastococcus sp. PRF04-17]